MAVPKWYIAACWVIAIACSVLAGYHYSAPDAERWIALFGAAAIAAAALQARTRALVLLALGVGIADATWSGLELARLWDIVAPRELWHVGAVAAAALWLLVAAALRAVMRV